MKIFIDDEVFIEVDENDTEETVVSKLSALPLISEIAKKVGKDSYFAAFPSDLLSGDGSNEIAEAYLEGGRDAVIQHFIDEDWDAKPSDYYFEISKGEFKQKIDRILGDVLEEFDNLNGEEIKDELSDYFEDTIIDAMIESDDSKVEDCIPSHAKVDIVFIPDNHIYAWDDMYTHHWDVCFSAETALADSNMIRVLKFFNISPEEFIEEAKERGFDPSKPEISENISDYRRGQIEENALKWRAILEARGIGKGHIRQLKLPSKYEMAEWNRTVDLARTCRDYDRPSSVSMDTLFTILDNASYGGVSAFVCRVPLTEVMNGVLDKPFTAMKGLIGIHDFMNGSGYIDQPEAPILIDPKKGKFSIRSVDDVYGIVPYYYNTEIQHVEVGPWIQNKPGKWLNIDDDGRFAEISRTLAEDGIEEFWVSTCDKDGDLAGPRETSEVFLDLGSAKADAEKALSEEWTADPSPQL